MAKRRSITPFKLLLGIISVFVGLLIFSFLTEMLADDAEDLLKKVWGEKNHIVYLILILSICLILMLLLYLLENTEAEEMKTKTNEDTRLEFLKNLGELYKKRLYERMTGELNFEIKLKYQFTTKGNFPETIEDFYIIDNEVQAGDFNRLFDNYVNYLWRLLILGEPGAGKSILLLRFGLRLVEMAKRDPNFPIPILLDLATWKNRYLSFDYWLESNLPYIGGSFAISKKYAKRLIESKNILLLLDGFDEISLSNRNSCFEAMLPFLQNIKNARIESYPEVIICSRVLEYEAAGDAPVFASVKIQPLTENDVKLALKPLVEDKNFPAAKRLQTALKQNTDLLSVVSSAFFMHTLLCISQYCRPIFKNISEESLEKEIIEIYIRYEFEKISKFEKEKAMKWLGWLSWKMKYLEGNINFELIDMQPTWVKKTDYSNTIMLISSIIGTCVAVYIFIDYGSIGILIGFFVFWLCCMLISIADLFNINRIETKEIIVYNFNITDWEVVKTIGTLTIFVVPFKYARNRLLPAAPVAARFSR